MRTLELAGWAVQASAMLDAYPTNSGRAVRVFEVATATVVEIVAARPDRAVLPLRAFAGRSRSDVTSAG